MTTDERYWTTTSNRTDDIARRVFNLVAAASGLLVLSPILLAVAVAIKLDSPGPVLFRQTRVGRGGKTFEILKLRSMRTDAQQVGGQLTIGEDDRVTRVGRLIRAWKVDELPQLVNVLRGDMELVGPRPEVPRFVDLYSPEQRLVLRVRPGITDPASVEFRYESELMAGMSDPESYYVSEIMPRKIELNLAYLRGRSLTSDIGVILNTLSAVTKRAP